MNLKEDEDGFLEIFGLLQWIIILGILLAVGYGAYLAYDWATSDCLSSETTAECITRSTTEDITSTIWGGIVGTFAGLWNGGKKIGEDTTSWLPWNWW